MKLVKCTQEYWEFVRELRTNPKVVDGFIQNIEITPEQQKQYMKKYSDCYRIALLKNQPV
jgi:hypothetical protein